jgi:hypothetical protein
MGPNRRAQDREQAADAPQGDANPPEPAEITRLGTGAMRPRISGPICRLRRPRRRLQRLHLERLPCLRRQATSVPQDRKAPGAGRARPRSDGMMGGPDRFAGVMGSLGRVAIGTGLPSGGDRRAPCSIRRFKPLRNHPLVWRKRRPAGLAIRRGGERPKPERLNAHPMPCIHRVLFCPTSRPLARRSTTTDSLSSDEVRNRTRRVSFRTDGCAATVGLGRGRPALMRWH